MKINSAKKAKCVKVDRLPGATNRNMQQHINHFASAGLLDGGVIVDTGSETIKVELGEGTIRDQNEHDGDLFHFDIAETTGIAIPTDTTRWIGIEYNNGNPQVVIKTTDTWNFHTEFPLGNVVNESGTLHILNNPQTMTNFGAHALERLYETEPFKRADRIGGLLLGEVGTRNVTLTPGEIYDRVSEFDIFGSGGPGTSINTGTGDSYDTYTSGGLVATGQTQWDNDNYDLNGTLTSLGAQKFANLWFYLEPNDSDLVMVYGTAQYNTEGAAEEEGSPQVLPDRLVNQGKLLGRFIFKKGEGTTREIDSVFTDMLSPAGVTAHGDLSGLGNDDHAQYILADGTRAIQPISDSTTAFQMKDQGGNVDFNYDSTNGFFGIGLNNPTSILHLNANDPVLKIQDSNATSRNAKIEFITGGGTWRIGQDSSLANNDFSFINTDGSLSMMIERTTGNVGIGTAAPLSKLHVFSGTPDEVARFESSDAFAYNIIKDNSDSSYWGINGGQSFAYVSGNADGTNGLTVNLDNGNVGIVEPAPVKRLEIRASATTNEEIVHIHNSNGIPKIKFGIEATSGDGYLKLIDGDNNEDVRFSSKSNVDSYINSGANFGIGTITPDTKLQVVGDTKFGDDNTNYVTTSATGDMSFVGSAGFYPRLLRQDAQPANGTGLTQIDDEEQIIWIDTNDSNRTYLVYNDNTNAQIVKVELT